MFRNKKFLNKIINRLIYILRKYVFYIAIFVIIVILISQMGIRNKIFIDSKTMSIGFENIGEFSTQSTFSTQIGIIDKQAELWGLKIPFTQSKYIYSYDVVVKAGFDFSEIEWSEKNNVITVKMPKVKTLSNEIVEDSFKIYHEQESIFTPISMAKTSEGRKELKEKAEQDAIASGLYENAEQNAESMLTAFFSCQYDMEKYKIKFVFK